MCHKVLVYVGRRLLTETRNGTMPTITERDQTESRSNTSCPEQRSLVGQHFGIIFASAIGLTIACLVLSFVISITGNDPLSMAQQRTLDAALQIATFGSISIIALLKSRSNDGKKTYGGEDSE